MPRSRITTVQRAAILRRLIEHRFGLDQKAHQLDKDGLAMDVYADVYPPEVRAQMEALPKGMLARQDHIRVGLGGRTCHLYFGEKRSLLVGHNATYYQAAYYAADHEFSKRHLRIESNGETLSAAIASVRRQAEQVIRSATTLKRLREVWPEVESFLAGLEGVAPAAPTSTALTVPLPQLNAALRLPPK